MAYREDFVKDENGKIKCELCKTYIRDSDGYIEEHLGDKTHVQLIMKRLLIQNNVTITNNQVCCGICEERLDISNVLYHIKSAHHQDQIDLIRNAILKDNGFLVLPESITNLGSAVKCLVCNRNLKCNLKEINSHVFTERHRRARSIAVQPLNAIFSVEDSNDYLWCKICKVYFDNYIELIFEHVDENPKHLKEIHKLVRLTKEENISIEKFLHDPKEDKAFCKKCNLSLPCNIINLAEHVRGGKHING